MHDDHPNTDNDHPTSTTAAMATWATDADVVPVGEQMPDAPVLDEATRERATRYATRSKSRNTLRAYDAAWLAFVGWCRSRGYRAMPADPVVVAGYLADRAGELKPATLAVHLAAINAAHRLPGLESPTGAEEVRAVLAGIKREHGVAPAKKDALSVGDIKAICAGLGDGARDVRDRALLLTGFAGAFRRSELVALDIDDVEQHEEGVLISLRRSKTDQAGEGAIVPISYGGQPETCPVRALRAWVQLLDTDRGPLFRGVDRHGSVRRGRLDPGSVGRIVKRLAADICLDGRDIGAHSLRAGLVTAAATVGIPLDVIMNASRHASTEVALGYVRRGDVWRRHDGLVRRLGL